ncbi:SNF2 family helicase [Flavobacterium sp. TP390]|uniref:SNF2 family helicase n=1 Tax=Flavobacterium profundi TaxID=1774945 RepID=A0A6I4ISJ9_9FLAO|nr:DEAD/DEAH box helicase [Flavobacterium profundi]MVO09736.1 SNF2 family helicase [Flavobacterium profundi]
MKIYKGELKASTKALIDQNKRFFEKILKPIGLGKVSQPIYTLDETIEKHNPGISKDEINAWIWYRNKKGIPMKNWGDFYQEPTKSQIIDFVKRGILFVDNSNNKAELVPYPVFVFGNLYEKIAKTKKIEEEIVSNYGISTYNNHLEVLEKLKPKVLSITNPVVSERPVFLAIGETAKSFVVNSIKDIVLREPETLQEAFKDWLRALPDDMFNNTRSLEIINYYLNNESKPRRIDEIEWKSIKKITRDEGERLFKIFLHTGLEYRDQVRLDAEYNSKFNAIAPLQYHKIPVAFQVSKLFNGLPLSIRDAQREGIAFLELVGSGIVAYDVGVGKTITAIIEMANALNTGKCKRPIVAVPNPTYKNWIAEIIGIDGKEGILTGTGITINEWYNLGSDYSHIDLEKKVPERSITLVTYEGLQKIGFSKETSDEHFQELANILSQNDDKSERDAEKENEKLREIIGVGNKETIADIETLGFDYIVVDEAHNFKNVFSEVKADKQSGKQFHIRGGQPSNRGIKLFFLCNYIQRTYGRNVMLLTATPFTNSPLEIYSMLSFVAYDYMKSWGIYNIRTFFEQYISETTEDAVGVDGEIQQKNVVKSFNNRISLQKLINSHINFKTGEEANIPRPCKINLPKTSIITDDGLVKKLTKDKQLLTYLKMNPIQEANQRRINSEASEGASQDDPGKLLRLMSQSLNNALSPFLYSGTPKDYLDFIENSPKIKYTLECIKTVKQWHEKRNEPVSGQVIYIDRGKQFFPYIKEYLEKELGYKKGVSLKSNPKQKVDEVEFITSGITQANKEKIKAAFNEGVCKIIIGTSTIKEGLNLQKKSTVLYNLYPNWNPTDLRQLEGRVWRQKNEFGYVRIVMPLMENSMDVFVFQKLEEKTSRINDLWSKSDRGNVLDEESLDPNEVKFALVTDLGVLLRYQLKQIDADLRRKVIVLNNNFKDLENYTSLKQNLESFRTHFHKSILEKKASFKSLILFDDLSFNEIGNYELESFTKEKQNIIEKYQSLYDSINNITQNYDDKELITVNMQYSRIVHKLTNYQLEKYKETLSQYLKIKRTIFELRGYSENTDLEIIKDEIQKELLLTATELENINTVEFQEKLMDKIIEDKKKYSIKGGELSDRVKDFSSLNYLMSYKFSDIDHTSCSIPGIENKSQSIPIDKDRRLRLAKAKAKALKIKLKLIA